MLVRCRLPSKVRSPFVCHSASSLLARLGVSHGNGGLDGVWRNGNTLVVGHLSLAAISGRLFRDTYCMGGETSLAGGGVGNEGAVGDDGE
jgi:hypothetical protein